MHRFFSGTARIWVTIILLLTLLLVLSASPTSAGLVWCG
jgi:hypothetical protein